MDLHVSLDGDGDLTTRLYRGLRDAVRDGRLRSGERLPPTRELATRLSVARGTVATAYERLVAEGFLVARVGAGTYVADDPRAARPTRRDRGAIRPRSSWTFLPAPVSDQDDPRFDFRVGVPDTALFPFDTWRRLVTAELRVGAHDLGTYADPAGHLPLREAIVADVKRWKGIDTTPDQVVVTPGAKPIMKTRYSPPACSRTTSSGVRPCRVATCPRSCPKSPP